MATEKSAVTTAFYMQLTVILTIVISSLVGFNAVVNKMESIANAKLLPLIERIEQLEEQVQEFAPMAKASFVSGNLFIDSYNRAYHREFLRPLDLREETMKPKRKKS